MRLITRSKSSRLAAIALLALLVGQLAVLSHAVADEHQPGEVCEVCVSTDRLSDALITTDASLDFSPLHAIHEPVSATRIHERFAHIVRSRGPPSL